MKRRFGLRLLLGALAFAGTLAAGTFSAVSAQSTFATRALGFPMDPVGGRAQGLGGAILGLSEPEISWINPAAAARLPAAGMTAVYQFDRFSADLGVLTSQGSTARFPLLLGAFPAGRGVIVTAGFGSFLDQNWAIEEPETLIIGLDTVSVLDRISSEGGVARLRLGAAYPVTESIGVGLAVDSYSGEVERVQGRIFPGQVEPSCCRAVWRWSGLGYSAGVKWTPSEAIGVGASASFGGTLEASPRDAHDTSRSYSIPLTGRIGATGRVGQNSILALSGSWTGWSGLDGVLEAEGGARDSWAVQGGVEWDAMRLGERPLPIRIGARTAALPFHSGGTDRAAGWAQERALTGGMGILLGGGAVQADVASEWGGRGGAEFRIDESYWRFTLSVRIIGR